MMLRRSLKDNNQGLVLMGIGLLLLAGVGVMIVGLIIMYYTMQTAIENIVPLGGVIIAILVLPTLAKGWMERQKREVYAQKGGRKQ